MKNIFDICNRIFLGFLSVATQRVVPSSSILFHRTQATNPPPPAAATPNVPAGKIQLKDKKKGFHFSYLRQSYSCQC